MGAVLASAQRGDARHRGGLQRLFRRPHGRRQNGGRGLPGVRRADRGGAGDPARVRAANAAAGLADHCVGAAGGVSQLVVDMADLPIFQLGLFLVLYCGVSAYPSTVAVLAQGTGREKRQSAAPWALVYCGLWHPGGRLGSVLWLLRLVYASLCAAVAGAPSRTADCRGRGRDRRSHRNAEGGAPGH